MISFLNDYNEAGIFDQSSDPFSTIDEYVGNLMKYACDLARSVKPEIKIGVCGEHGGDPKSIKIFKEMGVNYVSSSPYRLPVAGIAVAKE
jgi:pyruvate,orthophosphate dikinase